MHEAKLNNTPEVEIWGSGKPRREFLYSEDMADACVFILENRDFVDLKSHTPVAKAKMGCNDTYEIEDGSNDTCTTSIVQTKEIRNTHINIGTGVDISIKELALTIKKIVDYKGELYFNDTKPDGTMIKLTDPSKLHSLGWKHKIELEDGIRIMYNWYLKNGENDNV
jgi:GDP-L-fucose synthase